jgi:hypothetical protein
VGHSSAVGALDRGWEAAVGAADGETEPRTMSGEVWGSEQEKLNGNRVCKCKSRHARSSRRCSESRLRWVAWEPELAAGGVHGGHGVVRAEAGVARHAKKRTAGRAAAAAGRGATRGVARKQEVVLGAATASGGEARLGQTAGGVARRGGARARPGSGRVGTGAACGLPQGGSGAGRCTAHGRQSGGGGTQRNRGGGREVDKGGLDCNFQKGQGPYRNA